MPSQFSRPSNPGDTVSVLVLVEDSRAMTAKWDEVQTHYLPTLLENLRAADMAVLMRVWWFTSSPTFTPISTTVTNVGQYNDIPNLSLGQQSDTPISTAIIRRSINAYIGSSKQRRSNQHLIIIASSPLMSGTEGPSLMQSGIDPWLGTALALCQENIRLHLIVGPASETRSFRDLFDRARYVQSLSEIPSWFDVDTSRFSIHLSGTASYRMHEAVGLHNSSLPAATAVDGNNPDTLFPSSSSSPPPSPTHHGSPISSRRSSFSATTSSHAESRNEEFTRSTHDSLGLVSYLQRMHGLTKKRHHGVRTSKRSNMGEQRASGASRPILPRLDLSSSPYPLSMSHTTDTASANSAEFLPASHSKRSSPIAERSPTDDRRIRARGSWLPTSPPATPDAKSSPDSTAAALRSLQSMTPRLTEFHTMDHAENYTHSNRPSGRSAELMRALAYHHAGSRNSAFTGSQSPSYISTIPLLNMHPICPQPVLDRSYSFDDTAFHPSTSPTPRQSMSYDDTPMTCQPASPLPSPSLTAPSPSTDNVEDQPFIVTPEYEAFVAARFEEAVRSGAMQASMTSSLSNALSNPQMTKTGPPIQPEQHASAYFPEPMHATETAQQAAYSPHQHVGLTSQCQTAATEWNSGQGYMHCASEYGVSPPGGWYAS